MQTNPNPPAQGESNQPLEPWGPDQIAAAVAARESAKGTTPAAVLDAWFPQQVTAAGIALQPVTLSTIMALQKLDSALLKQDTDWSIIEIARALFVMAVPISTVRSLISAKTLEAFEAAVELMCDRIPVGELKGIGEVINDHLSSALKNVIPYGVEKGTPADSPFQDALTTSGQGTAGSSH